MLSWRSKPARTASCTPPRATSPTPRAAARGAARGQGAARSCESQSARASWRSANESLRKSERRFRALIEHGSDSIAMIDTNSRIIYLSPAVTNIEGYQPEELLGTPRHRQHASRRSAGHRRGGREAAQRTRQADLAGLAPAPQGRTLDLARGCRHQHARRPFGGRHRHQLPRHHRAAGARIAARRADAAAGAACRASRAPSASARTCAASSRWWWRSIEDELPVDFCGIGLYDTGENRLTVSCVGARTRACGRAVST